VNKVTLEQLKGFEMWFFNMKDTLHQRYGQAFVNYCLEGSEDIEHSLFYEEDDEIARTRVWLFYVEEKQ
jgi:hypothetical protein